MSAPTPPGSDAPRVAVVIVSFNSRQTLPACLDSLGAQRAGLLETVVVDNASTDGSAGVARSTAVTVRVLANETNEGFARACNQGLRTTTAPLVLFLNPDAEARPGAVDAMAAILETRPEVSIVGPLTRNPDGTVQVSTGPDLDPWSERRQRRLTLGVQRRDPAILREAEALHSREHEPDWVSGSCLMARRASLEAVGGFDEGFFLYEEDADLCRRLRRAGGRVVFTPAAEIRHRLGRSMAQAPARARLEYHRSHLRYYRRHNGRLSRASLVFLLLARAAAGLLAGIVRTDAERRHEALALLRLLLARG